MTTTTADLDILCRRLFDEEVLRLSAMIHQARRAYDSERVAMLCGDMAAYRAKFPQYTREPA